MEIVSGKITNMTMDGMTVYIPYQNINRAAIRKYDAVQVGLPDGRRISPEQCKKAHALIGEISAWVGDLPQYVKRLMKFEFVQNHIESLAREMFSLSNCDVTTAREFISFLIDFILEHDIPTKIPLTELCEDIEKYVYACLLHKKCACCGKAAELHHMDAIGMGRDRTEVYQLGMKVISLCRTCHTKAHGSGASWLKDDMHLVGIPLTKEIGKAYRLSRKNLGQ